MGRSCTPGIIAPMSSTPPLQQEVFYRDSLERSPYSRP